MSTYKTEQHRVAHRGREFHFVSYEGVAANSRTGVPATGATWCLMIAGKRWNAIPQRGNETAAELDAALRAWLDSSQFISATTVPATQLK